MKLHKANVWERIREKGRVSRDLETTQRKADKGLEEQQHLDWKTKSGLRPLLRYKQVLYTTEAATMTKCPNETNNRTMSTMGMRTIARENNGK